MSAGMLLGGEDWINTAWMALFFIPALGLPGWLAAKKAGTAQPRRAWGWALGVTLLWGLSPLMMEWSRPLPWEAWWKFWFEPLWATPVSIPLFVLLIYTWARTYRNLSGRSLVQALALAGLWWSWCVTVFGHTYLA